MPIHYPDIIIDSNIISLQNLPTKIDLQAGVVILIDKPKDWTSFDIVNKLRFKAKYKLGVKKIKVGHAGTLDPMATGLLIVCIGKYTKLIDTIVEQEKSYHATLKLGATTPSFDAESEEDNTYPIDHISEALLIDKLFAFRGEIKQLPPMYSAIKINGQKLYDLARKGKTVERKYRDVTIHDITISNQQLPLIDMYIHCSKGTYIRSLADDYGRALGSGAYLVALRRHSIGKFEVKDALTVDQCVEWIEGLDDVKEL